MINRIAHQATAFGLAAVLTFGILASINVLATQPAEQGLMAAAATASAART